MDLDQLTDDDEADLRQLMREIKHCGQDLVGNYRIRAWLGVARALNDRNVGALMIHNHFQLGPTYPATNDYASLARINFRPHRTVSDCLSHRV